MAQYTHRKDNSFEPKVLLKATDLLPYVCLLQIYCRTYASYRSIAVCMPLTDLLPYVCLLQIYCRMYASYRSIAVRMPLTDLLPYVCLLQIYCRTYASYRSIAVRLLTLSSDSKLPNTQNQKYKMGSELQCDPLTASMHRQYSTFAPLREKTKKQTILFEKKKKGMHKHHTNGHI